MKEGDPGGYSSVAEGVNEAVIEVQPVFIELSDACGHDAGPAYG